MGWKTMLRKKGLAIGVLAAALASGSAFASTAEFNGTWRIQLVTEQGSCDGSYDYAVAVLNGAATFISGDTSANISGGVGRNGSVALTLTHSIATANASGLLRGNGGYGRWKVDAFGCSGHWTAARRI
jgi:hypothetical protein